ncbi:MAG: ABC transporter substrate-binding protein [Planctomycetota bacterium]
MWTKRILVLLPVIVCLFLLQSYFWVPTYEEQARATPDRLSQYITSSIGDAEVLNPVLHADSASGTICEMVYEALIDRDKDLNWRGRLAKSWEIFEEAYFVVNPNDKRTPEGIAGLIRSEMARPVEEVSPLSMCLANISDVAVMPGETLTEKVKEAEPKKEDKKDEDEKPKMVDVTVTVKRPARIKLTLKSVDQGLFKTLAELLGKEYFSSLKAEEHIGVAPAAFEKNKAKYAKGFLPATEHNPVVVFHLRRGVKFHDGHEFDSGDVKFTYESIIDARNRSPRIPDYEPVKSVETPDRYRVRVIYKRLFSPGFGTWAMPVLPEHLLNENKMRAEAKAKGIPFDKFNMRKSDFNLHPIGCGPFRFERWDTDEFIKLVRFDDYWEGPAQYSAWIVRIIPDAITQEMEFYAGAVDSFGARPNQVERLKADERFQNFSGLSYGYSYIGYNMRRELFKDKRVRRALGMAVDVDKILRFVSYSQAERITGPFVKQTEYYDHGVKPLPYDPEGALKLLKEAGWERNSNGWLEKDGKRFRFKLITNNGNDIRRDILAVAQDGWKKIGIDVSVDMLEWSVFISKYIDQGDFDACILGWSMGIEPDLYQIWHSSQTDPNELNFCAFKNAEADDLIIRIRQEYDKKKQAELCHRLHRIIADEQPYTFISVGRWTALLDRRIIRVRRDETGKVIGYERIKATKTGNYTYDFHYWLKRPTAPEFLPE